MKRRAGQDRERGATMLLVTISMVMLLLFGAFAVDLGGAWSQRRENQGAIDPAGIGGALETRSKSQAQAIADADAEIMRLTYSSIDPNMTMAQWQADWAACTDPAKGAEYTITGSSDCISYTANLQKIRAKTPLVDTETTFAAIIGLDTLQTDAFVEVLVGYDGGGGAILPFGLPGNAAGNTEICLKSGANPKNEPPCDGPVTGNFGFLDISEYGNELLNPPSTTSCTGATNTRLARNIARGVDHPILETPVPPGAGAPFRTDRDGCTDGNFNYGPYSLTTETGNKVGVLDNGFIEGVSGLPGRLTLSSDTFSQGGKTFDDKPLWEYLNGAGQAFCSTYLSATPTHDEMAMCLSNMSGNTVYFLPSLEFSPRLNWVPLFYGATLGLGNTTLNIQEFRPIYIQTTFWKCNASSCDAVHDPSEPIQGAITGNDKLEAVTALQIPRNNLPDNINDEFFGQGSETFYVIVE